MIVKLIIIGAIIVYLTGLIGAAIIFLKLLNKLWSKWIDTTKATVWFFDYVKNKRKYELWLKEQKSKEET